MPSNNILLKEILKKLLTKILSILLDKKAEGLLNQQESVIQCAIADFLIGLLRNTNFGVRKNPTVLHKKRTDIMIFKDSEENQILHLEIKLFLKPGLQIRKERIYWDILKLAAQKKINSECKTYLILAGQSKILKKALVEDVILELPHKFNKSQNRIPGFYNLEFFASNGIDEKDLEEVKELGIKSITIAPAKWKVFDGMAILVWKINKFQ